MTKNCPKCGKQLLEDAKFCMDCGYGMDDEQINSILICFQMVQYLLS